MENKNYIEVNSVHFGEKQNVIKLPTDGYNTFDYAVEGNKIIITLSNKEMTEEELEVLKEQEGERKRYHQQQEEQNKKMADDFKQAHASNYLKLVAVSPNTVNDLMAIKNINSLEQRIFWENLRPDIIALTDEEIKLIEERTGKHIATVQGDAMNYYLETIHSIINRTTTEQIKKHMNGVYNELESFLR